MVKRKGRKTKVNRKKRLNRTRRYRSQGGAHTESCRGDNIVILVEDQLEIAGPDQKFCLGDEFTTCTAIIVVMNNNFKVGAHINPYTFAIQGETGTIQTYNPTTVINALNNVLTTNSNFRDSTIKQIHVVTALNKLKIFRRPDGRGYATNINNDQAIQVRLSQAQQRKAINLTDENKHEFFMDAFPGKVTKATPITIEIGREVQYMTSGGRQRFFVLEDGTLSYQVPAVQRQ